MKMPSGNHKFSEGVFVSLFGGPALAVLAQAGI
jgi:hypothetical protein